MAATCSRSLMLRDAHARALRPIYENTQIYRSKGQDLKQYASSSRLPGSARPSRIPVKHTPVRHNAPSHSSNSREGLAKQYQQQEDHSPAQEPIQNLKKAALISTDSDGSGDGTGKGRAVATPADMETILGQDTLVVTREIEMMNIFIGFEQANKYALNTAQGETVGYIAEVEEGILGGSMKRQLMRTHRPFKATIMDTFGNIVMIIKRNFTWINSYVRIYTLDPNTRQEVLLGEVHQVFHVIRRKYELFVNRGGEVGQEDLEQFADIDEGLWAWDFMLKNDGGRPLGAISRNFRGFGRELFTDTGQYVVTFDPSTMTSDLRIEDGQDKKKDSSLSNSNSGRELMTSGPARALSIQERAVALATAVSADFDYFSRHSENTHGSMLPWIWMGGSGTPKEGEPAPSADGQNAPATQGHDSSGVQAPPPTPGSDTGGMSGAGTAAGYDAMGGGSDTSPQQQPYDPSADFDSPPPPSSTSGGDMGQGSEEVWGSSDPFGGASSPPEQSADDGWGWGNSGGGDGGGGGGGGWLDGWFDS